jgi:hypothetical protein
MEGPSGDKSAAKTTTPTDGPAIGRYVAQWAQASIVGLGLWYAIGLVIVNIDLGRHGVVNLDLARPEYVMAGGLWLFMTLIAGWGLYAGATFARDRWRESYTRLLIWSWKPIFFVCVVPFSILYAFRYADAQEFSWTPLLLGYVAVELNAALVVGVVGQVRELRAKPLSAALIHEVPTLLFQNVPTMLLFLAMYAGIVYPNVPKEFGGGRKPVIYVFLTEMPPVHWSALGYPTVASSRMVGPVSLIQETTGQIVVAPVEPKFGEWKFGSIGVDKRIISTVLYSGPKPKDQPKEVWHAVPPISVPPPAKKSEQSKRL